ncbi:hypothetical protein GCM10009801_20640 [Streptomyces albiaxialis]|uniref:Uncharacterized protein n=1 Tax=Streptomyces albiaxialis TaxID=329523 RepID=A0ABP5HD90_9ACTN
MRRDQPLLAEDLEGLPQRRTAHPEALSERVLAGQPLTGAVHTGPDLVGERAGDALMFVDLLMTLLANLSRHVCTLTGQDWTGP